MRSYRASSLGSCTRAQIAVQLGMSQLSTSDKMQALYDRGNDHEVECLAAMEADGWRFLSPEMVPTGFQVDEGQFCVGLEVAGAYITGHLDGLAYEPDNSILRVIEIKSPQSWAKWERAHKTGDYSDPLMHRYAWQISVYMVATSLEAVVACVEDGQVRTFGIEVPPFSLDQITGRVASLEYGVLHPDEVSVERMACSQSDYPCPVAYLHDKADPIIDVVLDQYFGEYALAKAAKDEADTRMKGLRDAIDAHLGLSDTLTTEAGTATRVPDSMVTDWKATAEQLARALSGHLTGYETMQDALDAFAVKKRRAGYINVTPKDPTDTGD